MKLWKNCTNLVHLAMRKKEIPHEFRIRDGGHTWAYWRESLPVVRTFISDVFHQHYSLPANPPNAEARKISN